VDLISGVVRKDGVKKALRDRQKAVAELVDAIQKHRKIAAEKPCLPSPQRR
jgi:hypothetical protein